MNMIILVQVVQAILLRKKDYDKVDFQIFPTYQITHLKKVGKISLSFLTFFVFFTTFLKSLLTRP